MLDHKRHDVWEALFVCVQSCVRSSERSIYLLYVGRLSTGE